MRGGAERRVMNRRLRAEPPTPLPQRASKDAHLSTGYASEGRAMTARMRGCEDQAFSGDVPLQARVGAEHLEQGVACLRRIEKVALAQFKARLAQEFELDFAFDSFRDQAQIQSRREMGDGMNNRAGLAVERQGGDEGAIDFEPLNRQPANKIKRRVACSEVVEDDRDADRV